MNVRKLSTGFATFYRVTPLGSQVLGLLICLAVSWVLFEGVAELLDNYRIGGANDIPPSLRLEKAKELCPELQPDEFGCSGLNESNAIAQLEQVPQDATAFQGASDMLKGLRAQQRSREEAARKAAATVASETLQHCQRLRTQSEDESRRQWLHNVFVNGRDAFACDETKPSLVSFDEGHYWWPDDGRCAAKMRAKQDAEQEQRRLELLRAAAEQKARDERAWLSSFWSTTLRVDTDMNSSWLPNEERTCQTYPDRNGRVSAVSCASGGRLEHNIPVAFWGGVDRSTVSNWRCRREDNGFTCRAIN